MSEIAGVEDDATATCACDPDDPCFCFPEKFNPAPRYKVRYSARFVEQYRDLSGDRRFPLRPIPPTSDVTP